MNKQINSTESKGVKPCVKCGAQERNNSAKCSPCARERACKWREANPEKKAESDRKWQKANPDKVAENNRKYREANPQQVSEKAKVRNHGRRARIEGNGGELSKDIVQRLMRLQKGKCACGCSADLKKTGCHLDHIMPLILGGLNDDANVQLLTPKCNLCKGAKHPNDWARGLGKLI
jgi:5-methylcytosine-specific restriction endonuclease McrA